MHLRASGSLGTAKKNLATIASFQGDGWKVGFALQRPAKTYLQCKRKPITTVKTPRNFVAMICTVAVSPVAVMNGQAMLE